MTVRPRVCEPARSEDALLLDPVAAPACFDGLRAHQTEAICGAERFSFIFFNVKGLSEATVEAAMASALVKD